MDVYSIVLQLKGWAIPIEIGLRRLVVASLISREDPSGVRELLPDCLPRREFLAEKSNQGQGAPEE